MTEYERLNGVYRDEFDLCKCSHYRYKHFNKGERCAYWDKCNCKGFDLKEMSLCSLNMNGLI